MLFFYIRHGDPIYDPDGLTEKGKEQAEKLSEKAAILGFDKIFASTSRRAIMTATPTAEKTGKEIETLAFANESEAFRYFGLERNGKGTWCFVDPETVKLFKSPEVLSLGKDWYKSELFKDTSLPEWVKTVHRETVGLFEKLGYRFNEENGTYTAVSHKYDRVALFAHGGFGMAFISELLGIPYPLFATRFEYLCCTGVCVFEIADEGEDIVPKLIQYGNDSHLYGKGKAEYNGKEIF